MKPIYSTTLLVWASVFGTLPPAMAQPTQTEVEAAEMMKLNWHTDIEVAKKSAAESGKKVYVIFTGSDWCPPCQELKKNVLDQPSFAKAASEKFEFVICDFPQGEEMSEKQLEHNKKLATLYNIQSLPAAIIADDEGQKIKEIQGYSGGTYQEYLAKMN